MPSLDSILKSAVNRAKSQESIQSSFDAIDLTGKKQRELDAANYKTRDARIDAQIPDIQASRGIDPRNPDHTAKVREYLLEKRLKQIAPYDEQAKNVLEIWKKSFGTGKSLEQVAMEETAAEQAAIDAERKAATPFKVGLPQSGSEGPGDVTTLPTSVINRKPTDYLSMLQRFVKLGLNANDIDAYMNRAAKGAYTPEDFAANPELFPKDASKEMLPTQAEIAGRKAALKPPEVLTPLPAASKKDYIDAWKSVGYNDAQIKMAIKERIKKNLDKSQPYQRAELLTRRLNEIDSEVHDKETAQYAEMEREAIREIWRGK